MNREFQVLYRARLPDRAEYGLPQVLDGVIADRAAHVEALLTRSGFMVLKVTEVRALVDWAKPNFTHEEAAAFLCKATGTFTNMKGDGTIPCSKTIYPRSLLEQYVKKNLNEAGKKLAQELAQETAAIAA